MLNLSFERFRGGREEGATKTEQVQTRRVPGSKFWAFCDNVIIECPLNFILLSIFFTSGLFSGKKVPMR